MKSAVTIHGMHFSNRSLTMSKDMLGIAVRKLVTLPSPMLGIVCDHLDKLADPVWVNATKKFLRKEEAWLADFSRDMTKEGWTLLGDAREPWPISTADLEPVPFLKEKEGEELVRRSREELHANLGQRHAEYLLENQDEIPEELRKFLLVFPCTIWRDRRGNRRVPYLFWGGGRWQLGFDWLGGAFVSVCRLLRPRK